MDERKLNTSDVLGMGILSRPTLKSQCPEDAALSDVDESGVTTDSLRQGLEAGGLSASMYYGCWKIWKTESGFSGELMQYRSVTGSFSDYPLDKALEKAEEWAWGCMG